MRVLAVAVAVVALGLLSAAAEAPREASTLRATGARAIVTQAPGAALVPLPSNALLADGLARRPFERTHRNRLSVEARSDSPVFHSLSLEVERPEVRIASPAARVGEDGSLSNAITLNRDFSGITTFQQSAGHANASSNRIATLEAVSLGALLRELFGPGETLVEVPAGKLATMDTTRGLHRSLLARELRGLGTGGGFVRVREAETTLLSPHTHTGASGRIANLIARNSGFSGITTFQQQAGSANVQSNAVVQMRSFGISGVSP